MNSRISVSSAALHLAIIAAVVLGSTNLARAQQDILAGMDAFRVVAEGATLADFAAAPIPADFFGPGSDPFEGQVAMESRSSDPRFPGPRIFRPVDGLLSGDPAMTIVPAEMVSLQLKSIQPIVVTSPMGDSFFDVYITLDDITPSPGQLGVVANGLPSPGGSIVRELPDGDFAVDSFFDITYRIDFNETCSCSSMSMPILTERIELAVDVPFSHVPPPEALLFPETSNFFPGADPFALEAPPAPLQFDGELLHLRLSLLLDPHLPSIMGDADYDLDVDLDDFVILKQNFGTMTGATWVMGDFNLDGAVDLDDFVILKNNFGTAAAR